MVSRREMMATIRDRVARGRAMAQAGQQPDPDDPNPPYMPGTRLPATKDLVAEFEVSEPTVLSAMQILDAEGTIQNRWGIGRFVPPLPGEEGAS